MLDLHRTSGKGIDDKAMANDSADTAQKATAGSHHIGEWFWRFLSAVMLFAVGWAIWIFYQLNPTPLITRAAFEAAAKARVARDARGVIAPAIQTTAVPAAAAPAAIQPQTPTPAQSLPASAPVSPPKEPPVNTEKLKLTDSIEKPIPERAAKK